MIDYYIRICVSSIDCVIQSLCREVALEMMNINSFAQSMASTLIVKAIMNTRQVNSTETQMINSLSEMQLQHAVIKQEATFVSHHTLLDPKQIDKLDAVYIYNIYIYRVEQLRRCNCRRC